MYHRVRKKMVSIFSAILILSFPFSLSKSIDSNTPDDNEVNNNIIDFDEEYSVKFNKKYGMTPWHANEFDKNSLRYTIVKDLNKKNEKFNKNSKDNAKTVKIDTNLSEIDKIERNIDIENDKNMKEDSTTEDFRVIPLELISTTQDPLISLIESTTEQDLTVIPLSTTEKIQVTIDETITLPVTTNYVPEFDITTENNEEVTSSQANDKVKSFTAKELNKTITTEPEKVAVNIKNYTEENIRLNVTLPTNTPILNVTHVVSSVLIDQGIKVNKTVNLEEINSEDHNKTELKPRAVSESKEEDVPVFTELDTELFEGIPDDYYDSKDVVPTSAPKTDAISVLFGFAGSVVESVVESVAERVVPKSIFDLFKRMQKQNEALEAERLRSREENGGLGQFGRGILKTISTGLAKPLTQFMEPKENGSLDTDRGFVASVASSVSSVANAASSVVDAFKDKVQAIYPGTVWCGDGHSAQARSSDLGLFFFTDTCCRQHDACKLFISSGETKYGLTNTGLFTRSHCSCDSKFRECLRRTNSLVSAQIGLTYFNVLGPQCFRRAHPIVRCNRKTRITGLKCEEYELDFTKPKMWQWFDNETF